MKGGLAAMIDAVRLVIQRGGLAAGTLIVAAVADEEHGSAGAEALVRRWSADAAVVTEPTSLDVAVAHKGFQWVDVQTHGRAAHGSRPKEGRDAILMMGRVLARLETLDRRLQQQPPHPVLGTPSLHASMVEGGHELSSYPVQARLQFERRTLPGEPATAALDEAVAILEELRREDPGFEAEATPMFGRDGYAIDASNPLPEMLGRVARDAGCSANRVGMSFWTDAAVLGAAGIPSVVFGPGGAGLHGIEEYVIVDDVLRCRDVLAELAVVFTAQARSERSAAGGAGV
jgi:acetylornithine deacetylase